MSYSERCDSRHIPSLAVLLVLAENMSRQESQMEVEALQYCMAVVGPEFHPAQDIPLAVVVYGRCSVVAAVAKPDFAAVAAEIHTASEVAAGADHAAVEDTRALPAVPQAWPHMFLGCIHQRTVVVVDSIAETDRGSGLGRAIDSGSAEDAVGILECLCQCRVLVVELALTSVGRRWWWSLMLLPREAGYASRSRGLAVILHTVFCCFLSSIKCSLWSQERTVEPPVVVRDCARMLSSWRCW